jgi:arginyl-tRNA synthetase
MQEVIRTAIEDVLTELGLNDVDFVVEHPADLSHGDYATNVAMAAGKLAGKAPREVAEQICAALEGQIEYVDKIDIAGPGFINFHLTRDFFAKETLRAVEEGSDWGKSDLYESKFALIEYTSPNLFKPLHVGNLVGNIIGESLTRLYEFAGATVKRLNYPSDIGLTVAKGVWGLKLTGGNPDDINVLGEAYRSGNEAYESGDTRKDEIVEVNKALYENSDEMLSDLRARGIATSRASLNTLLKKLGTVFDAEIYESEAGPVGTKIVREHVADGIFRESEGAVVFPGEEYGLHTRVFLNSKGLPTYEAKDLGNFAIKSDKYPDWTDSIVITGGEQTEYFKVVIAAIRRLFGVGEEKTIDHIGTGFLTLTTGKMSSRKGNVLTGESLFAEMEESARERAAESRADDLEALTELIAVAALKYQILRQKVGGNIVFDKAKALSFEGDSGPYLQYTYARTNSVLEKATVVGVKAAASNVPTEAYEVERILYRFSEALELALLEHSPHHAVTFLVALASTFNTFYAQEKIADTSDEYAPYKLLLTHAVKQTLQNGLFVLGMKAPEKM